MSTILDALRKVERERDPSQDRVLVSPSVVTEPARRLPMWVIAMGAIVGFGLGGILSWRQVEVPPLEVASLPAVPPPPAIAVPRPPMAGAPAPSLAEPRKAEKSTEVAKVAPPASAPSDAVAVAVPPQPSTAPPVEDPKAAADRILAAIEKEDSVLEPSPFSVPRDDPAADASVPAQAARSSRPIPPPAVPAGDPEQAMAAVEPAEPPLPDVAREALPEPEAEPEATPEALVDTGRSPPGAPKVALSFLQWSADPAKRFAFISIDGAATQRVREGEVASGMTVAAITPSGIQFKREGTTFIIRPRH
jgi:hypothetical protein